VQRPGMLVTEKEYGDFELDLEWRLPRGGKSGVTIRHRSLTPPEADRDGAEVRLVDEPDPERSPDKHRCGALFRRLAPLQSAYVPRQWNRLKVRCQGERIVVTLNGTVVIDTDRQGRLEGLPPAGVIGLHALESGVEFRNVNVKELR